MTRITVAIPTWNCAKLLDQTLTQMHKLVIPPAVEWELLVVHNCTDDTDAVIEPCRRFADPPAFRASTRGLQLRGIVRPPRLEEK